MKRVNLASVLAPRDKNQETEKLKRLFRKRKITVYLTGPITFVEEKQEYRKAIKEGLKQLSPKFKIRDPAERTSPLRTKVKLAKNRERKRISEEIIIGDLKEIAESDLLIAYIPRFSVGSPMEIFFAYRILQRPVLTVFTMRKPFPPPWLLGNSSIIFKTKRELFEFLKKGLEGKL
ncbi:MAG TPA: hypothetical protein ENG66_00085 [Thermococcus sp.]|nr:hypothetical protein [Thermococcus sp.]